MVGNIFRETVGDHHITIAVIIKVGMISGVQLQSVWAIPAIKPISLKAGAAYRVVLSVTRGPWFSCRVYCLHTGSWYP